MPFAPVASSTRVRTRAWAIPDDVVRAAQSHVRFLAIVALAPLSLWCVDWTGLVPGVSQAVSVSPTTTLLILVIPPYAVALAVTWRAVFHRLSWAIAWREARGGSRQQNGRWDS